MVTFTEKGLSINGNEIPFYSGSFHYWRSARRDWDLILTNIKNMGFSIVETYIPWAVHEPEEGHFDFGEKVQEHDLDSFLSLCKKKSLYVIVRPGPHINAEMENFGYPEWVVQDPEMTAKNPWGTEVVYPYITGPYAVPSYASKKFYEKVHSYFKRIAPILKKNVYPYGSIVAIQAENETCNFFRDNPFVMDYSRDSIAQFHRFLASRYSDISRLNRFLKMDFKTFNSVEAPTGLTDNNFLLCMEWVIFKEEQILSSVQKIIGFIDEMRLGIPIFHNCAYQTYSPISVQRDEKLEHLSVAGMDLYSSPDDALTINERIRFLSGSSRLCFVPEFGSGLYWDAGNLLNANQQEFVYLYAFMHGMKAVNFYMLVERNRWTGCPIKNNGSIRNNYYDSFQKLLRFLNKNDIWEDQRDPKVLILKNYDMGRIKSISSKYGVSSLSSNCFVEGPHIPTSIQKKEPPDILKADRNADPRFEYWILKVMNCLDEKHIDYDISDQFITSEKLGSYDYVFASMYPLLDDNYRYLLETYAAGPNHNLFYGPCKPEFNQCLEMNGSLLPGTFLQSDNDLIAVISSLTDEIIPEGISVSGKIETIWHKTKVSGIWHLYAANSSEKEEKGTITSERPFEVTGLWNSNDSGSKVQSINIELDAYEIRVYRVEVESKC